MSGAAGGAGERVLGWDVLRGLSALAVAVYHLLLWQGVTALHSFGSYGVYLFFVLSGASLAYTYAGRFEQGGFRFRQFLWVRYMRLAPLYLALMLLVLPWKMARDGVTDTLLAKLALNAAFLFGFWNPAANSVLIGGWSLGIEAVYYLAFPLFLWAGLKRHAGLVLLCLLLVLQLAWIRWTAGGPEGYAANAVAYHQVPAFAAYFMGGCLLGLARRAGRMPTIAPALVPGVLAGGFGLLWLLNPAQAGDELLGWRGLLCMALCFLLVWLSTGLALRHDSARAAAHLGDATYGLYLMHPVLFFGLTWTVIPRLGWGSPEQWPVGGRLALSAAVIGSAFLLALASERFVEKPLREWSKRRALR
ncbi:acyltransferase [uncultured Ramlibacter sp.]|uniref:acyltransferase family protein n=1 Tax=uncultured Ramlibacter sp. TaxID=260755 RepID=UPI0026321991|nr:acyltransferase [uncultured Ramlibacter sp.]